MKNTITSIIAIAGISVGLTSIAEASDRDRGYYSEKRIVKKIRHDDQRRWKYRNTDKRRNHDKHFYRNAEKHRHGKRFADKHAYKHKGKRFVKKHVYHRNGRRIIEKHVYHKPRHRVEKRVYHHYAPVPRHRVEKRVIHHYAPRHRVVEKVIVRDRHYDRHGNPLPALAGGIIGSAIANDLSHGDPAATIGGAVFGAMLGDALSHH
jgi:hypothetical protein